MLYSLLEDINDVKRRRVCHVGLWDVFMCFGSYFCVQSSYIKTF